jgi:hypothetical protein
VEIGAPIPRPRQRRLLNERSLAIALGAITLAYFMHVLGTLSARSNQMDFSQWYVSARAFHNGVDLYRTNLQQFAARLNMNLAVYNYANYYANYPPTFILLFEPLSWLPPLYSYWIWTACSLLLLAEILHILLGAESGCSVWVRLSIAFLIALFLGVRSHLYFAQVQLLILYLLLSADRFTRNGRAPAAGAVLGLACLLKIYPFVMLGYWIVRRQWATVKYALVTVAVGSVVTVVLFGKADALGFVHRLPFLQRTGGTLSIKVMVFKGVNFLLPANVATDALRRVCEVLAVSGVLAVAVYGAIVSSPDRAGDQRSLGLWLVATVLLTPTAWDHYMVLFIPTLVQVALAAYLFAAPRVAVWCGTGAYLLINAAGLFDVNLGRFGPFQVLYQRYSAELVWLNVVKFLCAISIFIAALSLCTDRSEESRMTTAKVNALQPVPSTN